MTLKRLVPLKLDSSVLQKKADIWQRVPPLPPSQQARWGAGFPHSSVAMVRVTFSPKCQGFFLEVFTPVLICPVTFKNNKVLWRQGWSGLRAVFMYPGLSACTLNWRSVCTELVKFAAAGSVICSAWEAVMGAGGWLKAVFCAPPSLSPTPWPMSYWLP